jgi:hypothetical protein
MRIEMGQFTGHGWVTNNPVVAKQLREADRRYEVAKIRAAGLSLGEKIVAYGAAKRARERAYDEIYATEEALR